MPKTILDVACGSRMFYFDKADPRVIFCDIRNESHILCDGRKLDIAPDIQADFRKLPFKSESFDLVIFDPPHLKGAGKKGWQAKKYGTLGPDWKTDIALGVKECFRVMKDSGTLIFKWNEQIFKVSEVIKAIGVQPLLGHQTMQNNKTIWLTFRKDLP